MSFCMFLFCLGFCFVMYIIRLINLVGCDRLTIFAAVAELCFQGYDFCILVYCNSYYWFVPCCYHFVHKPVNIELYFESTAVT